MIKNIFKRRTNNQHKETSTTSKCLSRNIGRLQNIQNFCIKHKCSLKTVNNYDDPIVIIINAIQEIIERNYIKIETTDDTFSKMYLWMNIVFEGDKILEGYFTIDEINDISNLDKRLIIK